MIDIDLLPQIRTSKTTLPFKAEWLFWGFALIAAASLGFLYVDMGNISAKLDGISAQVAEAEVRSKVLIPPREVRDLQDALQAAEKQLAGLERAGTEISSSQRHSVTLMQPVSGLAPAGIYLTLLTSQEDGTILVQGEADNESAIIGYAGRLQLSGLFTEVRIQSIEIKDFMMFTMTIAPKTF